MSVSLLGYEDPERKCHREILCLRTVHSYKGSITHLGDSQHNNVWNTQDNFHFLFQPLHKALDIHILFCYTSLLLMNKWLKYIPGDFMVGGDKNTAIKNTKYNNNRSEI